MISSAEEFIALRNSDREDDWQRARYEYANSDEVWINVIKRYPDYEIDVAQNETISETIFYNLAESNNWRVRYTIAMRRRLPKDLFMALAADIEPVVRRIIAANQKTPIELVKNLALDPDDDVSSVARYSLAHSRKKR